MSGALRALGRRLLRMTTALALLGALAVAATVATVVPQEPVVADTVAAWRLGTAGPGPVATALLDAAGVFDVFGSWWFTVLVALLVVSLTGCLALRYRALARDLRRPLVATAPSAAAHRAVVPTTAAPGRVLDAAERVLARRRFRQVRDGTLLVAERGRWREGGSLLFHTSLYLLLAGAAVGHTLGFTGQIDLAEGRSFTETRLSYDTAAPGRLFDVGDHRGFLVALDDFDLAVHPDGSAADYVATVALGSGDARRVERVRINHPARHEDTVLHLVRYGLAPELVVRDATGREVFRDAVRLRGAGGGAWAGAAKVRLGDPVDATQLALDVAVLPSSADDPPGVVDPRGGASAALPEDPLVVVDLYAGDLGLEQPRPLGEVRPGWAAGQVAGRATLRAGGTAPLGADHTVELTRVASWAGFQVGHAPGRGLLLAGGALMLAGLAPSLYAYRRRLWVSVDGTEVVVSGRSWQRHDRAAAEHAAGVAELRTALADGERRAAVTTGRGTL